MTPDDGAGEPRDFAEAWRSTAQAHRHTDEGCSCGEPGCWVLSILDDVVADAERWGR